MLHCIKLWFLITVHRYLLIGVATSLILLRLSRIVLLLTLGPDILVLELRLCCLNLYLLTHFIYVLAIVTYNLNICWGWLLISTSSSVNLPRHLEPLRGLWTSHLNYLWIIARLLQLGNSCLLMDYIGFLVTHLLG